MLHVVYKLLCSCVSPKLDHFSPFFQHYGTTSPPGSPMAQRPPSPHRAQFGPGSYVTGSNISLGLQFPRKSLSSHMRRAPSPTPAFNRNPSPNKPRWRM